MTALALVLALSPFARAVGDSSAEFLRLGAGAPAGLAEAGGAGIADATALLWNPAGLAALKSADAYAAHERLPESLRSNVVSVAVPLGAAHPSVAGYSLRLLSQDSLERLDKTGASQGSFSASDMAHTVGLAFARGPTRVGASLTFIRQSIDDASGSAFAAGAGVQRRLDWGSVGASVANVGSALSLSGASHPLPLVARAGAVWRARPGLLVAADGSVSKGRSARLHLGAGFKPAPMAEARVGYALGAAQEGGPSGLAFGAGLSAGNARADLSWRPFGEFGGSFQLGLGWSFR